MNGNAILRAAMVLAALGALACKGTQPEPQTPAQQAGAAVQAAGEAVAEAAAAGADKAGEAVEQAADKVAEVATQAGERVVQAGEAAVDKAGEVAAKVADQVAQVASQAADKAVQAGQAAKAAAGTVAAKATAAAKVADTAAQAVEKPAPAPAPAKQDPGPRTVVMKAKQGDVKFDHKEHGANYACAKCHGAGTPGKVSMGKESAHKVCKGCHVAEGAGPTKCAECHPKAAAQ